MIRKNTEVLSLMYFSIDISNECHTDLSNDLIFKHIFARIKNKKIYIYIWPNQNFLGRRAITHQNLLTLKKTKVFPSTFFDASACPK